MSYAWDKLREAVYCLTQPGSQRERLGKAIIGHLIFIRPKDLPSAGRARFNALLDKLRIGHSQMKHGLVPLILEGANDKEVSGMIECILFLYDLVTRYEPIVNEMNDASHGAANPRDKAPFASFQLR